MFSMNLRTDTVIDRAAMEGKGRVCQGRGRIDASDGGANERDEERMKLLEVTDKLERRACWLDETIVEIIVSEAQNDVSDF